LGCFLLVVSAFAWTQNEVDTQHWSRLPAVHGVSGIAARPFISDLSVTTDGVTTTSWTAATAPANSPPANFEGTSGKLIGVVSPVNFCNVGQQPAQGTCYAIPNRVALDFYQTGFVPGLPAGVTNSSIIDMTIHLNAFSLDTVWSWMNGEILYLKHTTDSAGMLTTRMKFRPVLTPSINWTAVTGYQCCTCDMPSDCNIQKADAMELHANFFVQMQGSLQMKGSVFATSRAVMGAMAPQNGKNNLYQLEYRLASSHLDDEGELMKGTITAFIPGEVIETLFGNISDLTSLSLTRDADGGTDDSIDLFETNEAEHGLDGVGVRVEGITFSAPTYILSSTSKPADNTTTKPSGYPALTGSLFLCGLWGLMRV